MIHNSAAAGIPYIKYNMSILVVLRIARSPGWGDATYSTWKLKEAHPSAPLTRAGHLDADAAWERITYFLERVVPVAAEYKIRIACHPHDPGVPPDGYQGVVCVLGTVDGLKKFIAIEESPYHGLNFCQGTVSEMLQNPGRRSSTSFDTLASARRSSTCTSAISAYIATSLWRCSRMKAMSISSRPFRCTKKFVILTC